MKSLKDFGLKKVTYPIQEYDANGLIHFKDSDGYEWWLIEEGKLELKSGQYFLNGEKVEHELPN